VSRDIVIGVCRALSSTGSIGVDITVDTGTSARTARLGLPLLPCVLLDLSASLRAQHGPAGPTAWARVARRGTWRACRL